MKNCFRKVGISEKLAEGAIDDEDDPFKELAAEELEETINQFRERLPNEVPDKLDAAVLLDINAELLKSWQKRRYPRRRLYRCCS